MPIVKAVKIASNNTLIINSLNSSYTWKAIVDGNIIDILPFYMVANTLTVPVDTKFLATRQISKISHYEDKESEKMTVEEWNNKHNKLMEEYDDESETWSSLDAEFASRKFHETWTSVRTMETVVEEAQIDIVSEVQFETGSEFITSTYVLGGKPENAIYSLNIKAAVRQAFFNKMKELGMEQADSGIDYGATKDKKVFAIEKHGDLRYTKAFGTYIFNDNYNPDKLISRTSTNLKELQALEKEHTSKMEMFIETEYKKHFVRPVADGVLLSTLSSELNSLLSTVQGIESKVSGQSSKRAAISNIKKLIDKVNEAVQKA